MKYNKIIFIHSLFRAGSTYIFNKFRMYDGFHTYYEPLHHDLVRLRKETLNIWKFDKKATDFMNHPELNKPHFYEFESAFMNDSENLPFYDIDFAYTEFFNVTKNDLFSKYINNLINTAPENKIPIFQFNRTSCRINWFKNNYPSSLNIFLLRNPRDQFESYVQRGELDKNIFLSINLYIIMFNNEASKKFLRQDKMVVSNNVTKNLSECMKLCKKYTLEEHYKIFFYIWILSFLEANKYSNLIIDMDRINYDKNYFKDIKKTLDEYTEENFEFDDYKIKNNNLHSIDLEKFLSIEKEILEEILESDIKEELRLYLSVFSNKTNIEKKSFLKYIKRILKSPF